MGLTIEGGDTLKTKRKEARKEERREERIGGKRMVAVHGELWRQERERDKEGGRG